MNLLRVWSVARKESLHVLRDARSLMMAIAIPVLLLILFGYALTLDVNNVPMAVWDQSGTSASRELLSRFVGSPYFMMKVGVDNDRDLIRAIDDGTAMVGLVIPSDFGRRVDADRDVAVQFIVDGSNSNTATIAIGYAEVVMQIYNLELASQQAERRGGRAILAPLDVRARVWFNEELESKNFIVPGLIAVIMMVIAALLTSLTVAREWERGTMEQLISTPVKGPELILGKLLPYFAVGMVDVLLIVVMGQFVFHVPLRGNVALLFGLTVIFLIGTLSMGILISIVAKSQLLASQIAMLATFLPAFLLSGFMFTIANMPKAIRVITHLVPARYFITILKGIYLKGIGVEILAVPIGLLVVFGVVMLLLANFAFKKKLM